MKNGPENSPLVSVIIPVYNVAPFLREALDSVCRQTYENLEILVIDDGSTDGSGRICDEYAAKDPRVLVIRQENRGLSAARNAGLDRMTGEYVAFLDADDAFCEGFVEKTLRAICDLSADLVVCRYSLQYTVKPMSEECQKRILPTAAPGAYDRIGALRKLASGGINVSVWNKLYRRALWDRIRFPDGHVHEDNVTTFWIFDICETVGILDETLVLHRKRPGSITRTRSLTNEKDKLLAYDSRESFLEAHCPEVFSPKQLANGRQSKLSAMIRSYSGCARESGREWAAFREELRDRIKDMMETIGPENLPFRKKTAWRMAVSCPRLLNIAYPAYGFVRRQIKKLPGRGGNHTRQEQSNCG